MTEGEFILRLQMLVAADTDPTLDPVEIDHLVRVAQRADPAGNMPTNVATAATWTASTEYQYGTVVTADPAADRWWMCIVPGTSGTTQPTWPTRERVAPFGTTVTEDQVVWIDVGTSWKPTYDLYHAVAEGWALKASKLVGRYDFTTDGQTFHRSQMIAHCHAMERRYRRKRAQVA